MSKRPADSRAPRPEISHAAWPGHGASCRWWPARARSARRRSSGRCSRACALADALRLRRRADAAGPGLDRAAVGGGAAAGERAGRRGAVLVLDEIQKVPGWSETVKRLWDEDAPAGFRSRSCCWARRRCSSSAGSARASPAASRSSRCRTGRSPRCARRSAGPWSSTSSSAAIRARRRSSREPRRWARYVKDALVETTISRDVLLLTRVDKPALLRQLFELACGYTGQELSYQKMLGQLQDAGNTTTLAHYLELLAAAGMVTGLQKFAGDRARRRASSPKLQVLNTALLTAQSGLTPRRRGRTASSGAASWSRRSGRTSPTRPPRACASSSTGATATARWTSSSAPAGASPPSRSRAAAGAAGCRGSRRSAPRSIPDRKLLVGGDGIPLESFLERPVEHWVRR